MGILSDVLGTVAPFVDVGMDVWGAKRASDEASANRDWNKMLADTAHQREVADLRAAGLNPVLSAGGGGAGGASGAVGAVPQMGNFGKNLATASQAAATRQQMELTKEQVNTQKATTSNIQADTANKISQNPLFDWQRRDLESQIGKRSAELPGIAMQAASAKSTIDLQDAQRLLTEAQTRVQNEVKRLTMANADKAEVEKAIYKIAQPYVEKLIKWLLPDDNPKPAQSIFPDKGGEPKTKEEVLGKALRQMMIPGNAFGGMSPF